MSDCVAVTSGCPEAFVVFDSIADQFGNPLFNGQFAAPGVSMASQLPPLLTATFNRFPTVVEFQMTYARAATNALLVTNEGPSQACILVSLNPIATPTANDGFGLPLPAGQSVLMTKPPAYQSTPSTTPVLTSLFFAGAALQTLAVVTMRFGNASVSYKFPANGPV